MSNPNPRTEGGLVLLTKDLLSILKEPDCIGIVFAVKSPGQAEDVNLDIYKAFIDGNEWKATLRNDKITSREASVTHDGSLDPNPKKYKFYHLDKLIASEFFFSLISKDILLDILGHFSASDRVFLTGQNGISYGNEGEFFSLEMFIRGVDSAGEDPSPGKLEGMNLGRPTSLMLQRCPPHWQP